MMLNRVLPLNSPMPLKSAALAGSSSSRHWRNWNTQNWMKSQKTIVNAWNEWDPLKHVIVRVLEMAYLPSSEPALRMELMAKLLFTDDAVEYIKGHPEPWCSFQEHG